jgi:hypothetical protein
MYITLLTFTTVGESDELVITDRLLPCVLYNVDGFFAWLYGNTLIKIFHFSMDRSLVHPEDAVPETFVKLGHVCASFAAFGGCCPILPVGGFVSCTSS